MLLSLPLHDFVILNFAFFSVIIWLHPGPTSSRTFDIIPSRLLLSVTHTLTLMSHVTWMKMEAWRLWQSSKVTFLLPLCLFPINPTKERISLAEVENSTVTFREPRKFGVVQKCRIECSSNFRAHLLWTTPGSRKLAQTAHTYGFALWLAVVTEKREGIPGNKRANKWYDLCDVWM